MRTRAAAAASAHLTADEDAPEEVSLASGREAAQLQRQEEGRAIREKRRAAKERRRKAAEPPAEHAADSAGKLKKCILSLAPVCVWFCIRTGREWRSCTAGAAAAKGLPTEGSARRADAAAGTSAGAEEELDLLSEHVVEALARERRCDGLTPAAITGSEHALLLTVLRGRVDAL